MTTWLMVVFTFIIAVFTYLVWKTSRQNSFVSTLFRVSARKCEAVVFWSLPKIYYQKWALFSRVYRSWRLRYRRLLALYCGGLPSNCCTSR